jgi:hypothetical protein
LALAADLPSAEAARQLVRGDGGALFKVAGTTLLRAGLIGTGLYVAGQHRRLVRSAIAGALAVEVFVLAWAWLDRDE